MLIRVIFLLILNYTFIYSNLEIHKSIADQAKDLESLVGRPFAWKNPQLKICSTNSKGETVGAAYFKNLDPNLGNSEKVAWYWHPILGFSIIASQNELLSVYGKDNRNPFQFSDMLINESGIVAFSFLVDQKGYNVCPWLWWSLNEGPHISNEPTSYQLVEKFNKNGFVLIKEFNQHPSFTLHIKHLDEESDLYTYKFDPSSELIPSHYQTYGLPPPGLEKELVEMVFKYTNMRVRHINHCSWGAFIVDEFNDSLNIKGHALVTVKFLEKIKPIFWHIYIRYEICDGSAKFIVEKITEAFVTQPEVYNDLNNKVIFEKNFFNTIEN